jgi:hypothetical protein
MQKTDWKNIVNFQSYAAKTYFDSPSWIERPFLTLLVKFEFRSTYKLIAKDCIQKCCQIWKLYSLGFRPPSWTSDAILNFTKNLFSMKFAWWYKPKTECKKNQNSLSYSRKTSFSALLKFIAILKTCEKNLIIFPNVEALILIWNAAKKIKNMLFEILLFLQIVLKWPRKNSRRRPIWFLDFKNR